MSNCPACDASLEKAHQAGAQWGYCDPPMCIDNDGPYTHPFCYCQGQFSVYPYVQNGVCMNGPGTLVPILSGETPCFCCCECYGPGTPVAVSATDVKAVHEFNINDHVWVASDANLKTWSQKLVLFSSGTGNQGKNKLIRIHFGDQRTGARITPESLVLKSVTQQQAGVYYRILSAAPNNFIDKDGFVNLEILRNAGAGVFAMLLATTAEVAEKIYTILSLDPNYLLVTGNQPFLMKDGSLKQAGKLVPGKDVLVRANGNATPIISLDAVMYEKGVHHIATSTEKATSLDEHLLLANGVVMGDYAVQISMSDQNSPIEDKYRNDPALGTEAYNEANTHLLTTAAGARVAVM